MRNDIVKKIYAILAAVIALVLALSGCAGKNKHEVNKKGGRYETIYLEMRATSTLDPLKTDKKSVRDVLFLCYEPLFVLDENLSPKGVIAKSWSMNDECTSVTVSIKEDIFWHDGKKLTSKDVVYTVNKIKETEDCAYAFLLKYVDSVQAVDSYTVRFNLSRKYAQFVYSLTFPILPSHKRSLVEQIDGSGAYMLDEYRQNDSLKLKKFNKWHGGDALTESIEVSVVRDAEAASALFRSGMLSAITSGSLDLGNYALKKDDACIDYPAARYEYMVFNHSSGFFSSAGVRSAISNAIDREKIVEECFGGHASVSNIPLHPLAKNTAPSPTFSAYDMNAALEMLFYEGYTLNEKSGLLTNENGFSVSFRLLVNSDNPQRCRCAELIASQLLKTGITVRIIYEDYDKYMVRIQNGEYDAYLAGTQMGNIFDFEFLLSESGELNNYGYSGEYMELALSNIASSPSRDSLENAMLNFSEVFMREQPVCGIAFMKDSIVSKTVIKGVNPLLGMPFNGAAEWKILRNN